MVVVAVAVAVVGIRRFFVPVVVVVRCTQSEVVVVVLALVHKLSGVGVVVEVAVDIYHTEAEGWLMSYTAEIPW